MGFFENFKPKINTESTQTTAQTELQIATPVETVKTVATVATQPVEANIQSLQGKNFEELMKGIQAQKIEASKIQSIPNEIVNFNQSADASPQVQNITEVKIPNAVKVETSINQPEIPTVKFSESDISKELDPIVEGKKAEFENAAINSTKELLTHGLESGVPQILSLIMKRSTNQNFSPKEYKRVLPEYSDMLEKVGAAVTTLEKDGKAIELSSRIVGSIGNIKARTEKIKSEVSNSNLDKAIQIARSSTTIKSDNFPKNTQALVKALLKKAA